jgi:hypothetical protein
MHNSSLKNLAVLGSSFLLAMLISGCTQADLNETESLTPIESSKPLDVYSAMPTIEPAPLVTEPAPLVTEPAPLVTETNDSQGCTPGYDPCLPPASDYDCLGGSGNGPAYTGYVRVTGPDIYDLDRDGDGYGCD